MLVTLSDKFSKNYNYDRTNFLVDGVATDSDWTKINKYESTPGLINISDLPIINSVSSAGITVDFGSNSNNEPAISIKSNGTISPGEVSVEVKRGKKTKLNY